MVMLSKEFIVLSGVMLLAAQTTRSQAYIQSLVAHGLHPEAVIILGEDNVKKEQLNNNTMESWQGVGLPNLAEPLVVTCQNAGISIYHTTTPDVNAEETERCILDLSPKIIIYSGINGQIVRPRLLGLGAKFLHLHSGWLPDYRGSTTLYYSLLDGELPAVTAILLDNEIDTGHIVARQHYPNPSYDMDIDYLYDPAIRADLLVQVMRYYASTKNFLLSTQQNSDEQLPYYVIHPVLKHMAILSLYKDTFS